MPPSPASVVTPPMPMQFQLGIDHRQTVNVSGIPSPADLAGYESVLPGAAERLIAMAERQSASRQELMKIELTGGLRIRARGQAMAFILALGAIIAGFILIFSGKSSEGFSTIIASVVALSSAFIIGKYLESKIAEHGQK